MLANCCSRQQALADKAFTPVWTSTGSGKFDENDEEGWILLPGGKVLTVDAYVGSYNGSGMNSEIYDPGHGRMDERRQHASATVGLVRRLRRFGLRVL